MDYWDAMKEAGESQWIDFFKCMCEEYLELLGLLMASDVIIRGYIYYISVHNIDWKKS